LSFISNSTAPPDLHSFPTRRSSDLSPAVPTAPIPLKTVKGDIVLAAMSPDGRSLLYITWQYDLNPTVVTAWLLPLNAGDTGELEDRKSTRLNSSHVSISYAVFCLKK